MMKTVAVVDYGMGNLRSVAKALEHVAPDRKIEVTADPERVAKAERVVVPGQGAMPDCMRELKARGLQEVVMRAAAEKPFLGICVGFQMLFERSDEGDVPGLRVLPGEVKLFPQKEMFAVDGLPLKVPHMGWNEVKHVKFHPLWADIPNMDRFYFVHSYYVAPALVGDTVGETLYGQPFTAACARDNIFAVQFHPEKSARAGLALLRNFINWNP